MKLRDDSTIESFGIDSLDAVDLVVKIEQKFEIQMMEDQVEKLYDGRFSEFVSCVAGKVK